MMDSDKKARKAALNKVWYEANREKAKARMKDWYESNREKALAQSKAWKQENREVRLAKKKIYDRKNREKQLLKMKAWRQENPDKKNALSAKHRAKKLQATPPWLTKLDLDHIAMFYEAAADQKQYGLDCHVDHIIPLQGKEVCGLHVPWNLQVLPASENISKGNRL